MMDKEKERVRLDKLGEILKRAQTELENMNGWDYSYRHELYEMKNAIDDDIISKPKYVEKFRELLYERIALTITIAFGIMAVVSGMIGILILIVRVVNGYDYVRATLMWASVTICMIFACVIAKTVHDILEA